MVVLRTGLTELQCGVFLSLIYNAKKIKKNSSFITPSIHWNLPIPPLPLYRMLNDQIRLSKVDSLQYEINMAVQKTGASTKNRT